MSQDRPLFRNLKPLGHGTPVEPRSQEEYEYIAQQYRDIQRLVEEQGTALERTRRILETQSNQPEAVTDQALGALSDAETMLRRIAGIELPKDRTEVYVKATTVYQLLEYHQDENLFLSLVGLSAGAALGILTNWATADSVTFGKGGWVALILCALMTLVFVTLWWRAQMRIRGVKKRLKRREDKVANSTEDGVVGSQVKHSDAA